MSAVGKVLKKARERLQVASCQVRHPPTKEGSSHVTALELGMGQVGFPAFAFPASRVHPRLLHFHHEASLKNRVGSWATELIRHSTCCIAAASVGGQHRLEALFIAA